MLKRTEKLPRGSYFYIAVGERFYAGKEPEIKEVKDAAGYYAEAEGIGGYMKPKGGSYYDSMPYHMRVRRSEAEEAAKHPQWHKRTGVVYNAAREYTPRETPVKTLTGRVSSRLCDDVEGAKKFRRRIQAETACDMLNRQYGSLDIKVEIKLHEGK